MPDETKESRTETARDSVTSTPPLVEGERVRVVGGAWESSIGKLATVKHVYPPADDGSRVIRIVVDGEHGSYSLAAFDVARDGGDEALSR